MSKFKKNKGITLIALIITIIILLILAVISINAVTGDGIIQYAKNSKSEYGKAQTNEQSQLSKYEYEIAKAQGAAAGSYREFLLQKEYEEKNNAGTFSGTYMEYVTSKYGLGTATNTENYGKKVVGYKSKGEGLDTLVWRLFYQDDNNAYLISETSNAKFPFTHSGLYTKNSDSTYTKNDMVKKYNSGADVSVYGQVLMPEASSLFTTSNLSENIIATAYLCDPEVWDPYTDAEGKASYAIGSPTIELFAKSYNASNLGNTITLTVNENADGYAENTSLDWFTTSQKSKIYNLEGVNNNWVLASPSSNSDKHLTYLHEVTGKFDKYTVAQAFRCRPIVVIPVSEFLNSYTLSD